MVQPGQISVADAIEVVRKPDHDITVTTMFRAFTTERELLSRLLDAQDDLPPRARAAAQKYAARHAD